jgi:DNA-binding transcriptional regulator YiaG
MPVIYDAGMGRLVCLTYIYSNCYKDNVTANRIKALRKRLHLTQQQLADMIAATQVTVARWETGVNQPKGAYLKALNELAIEAERKAKRRG